MRWLPLKRFVIEVPAAPDEVRRRLLAAVAPRGRVTRGERPLKGTVDARSFQLQLELGYFLRGYQNAFAPVAHGTFEESTEGTRLAVRMRLAVAVLIFEIAWLAFAAVWTSVVLGAALRDAAPWWAPLVGFAFVGVGYSIMIVPFSHDARRMQDTFERLLLDATPATDLPRSSLSWLSDFTLRGAEPFERRFNSIFLGVTVLAGLATLLNWERTVPACTKEQYGQDEFSCPSDARIILAWSLAAIVILSGFASRFALHRRLRLAYVPLLLVVVAAGAAALWMATHHPRWGVPG